MQDFEQKIIQVNPETRESLMKKFNCCRGTLYNALAYRSVRGRAEDIRIEALKMGGRIIVKKITTY